MDTNTNDYPKKLNGTYEDIDLYIDCMNNIRIYYYGKSVLQAYIPSLQRGHNIIKAIQEIDPSIIFDIEETDKEVLFKFKYVDSDKIIPLLKPRTNGAKISPYSNKNRPKSDYEIPDEDLKQYKDIVAKIPQERILLIKHNTESFVKSLASKRNTIENIKSNMRLYCMNSRQYIHFIGKWEEYIQYLTKNITF